MEEKASDDKKPAVKEDFVHAVCANCGINFKFPAEVEHHWRADGKIFYCPNGHGLSFPKPKDPDKDAEIAKLKARVWELEKLLSEQKAKCSALQEELEIWKPRPAEGTATG